MSVSLSYSATSPATLCNDTGDTVHPYSEVETAPTQQEIEPQTFSSSLPQEAHATEPGNMSSTAETAGEQLSVHGSDSSLTETAEPSTVAAEEGHKPELSDTGTGNMEVTATKSKAVVAKDSAPTESFTEEVKSNEATAGDLQVDKDTETQQIVRVGIGDEEELPSSEGPLQLHPSAQTVTVSESKETVQEQQTVQQAEDHSKSPPPTGQSSEQKIILHPRRRASDSSSPSVIEPATKQTVARQRQRRTSDSSSARPIATPFEERASTQAHICPIAHEATQTPLSTHGVTPTLQTTPTSKESFSSLHANTSVKPSQTVPAHLVVPPTSTASETTPTCVQTLHSDTTAQHMLPPPNKGHLSTKTHTTPPTNATDTQKGTSTADLALVAATSFPGAHFSGAFQPVIQVTPSGPVMTLVPTAQLQMASLQLSQGTENLARKKATNMPAHVSEAGTLKFGSMEKKRRAIVHPEAIQATITAQMPSIQKISVPKPQTLESTQVIKCHLEPTNIASQTESTKPSQLAEPTKLPHQVELATSSSQLTPTTTATKHQHSSQSVLTQATSLQSSAAGKSQLSAPVARVPVVQSTGTAEEVGEREGMGDGEMQVGGKIAEKLMVQKAEILGAGELALIRTDIQIQVL